MSGIVWLLAPVRGEHAPPEDFQTEVEGRPDLGRDNSAR
jgi:hypothetical protein